MGWGRGGEGGVGGAQGFYQLFSQIFPDVVSSHCAEEGDHTAPLILIFLF